MDQQIVNAIFIVSIYALFAVGYTLVFGVLDILNLAHRIPAREWPVAGGGWAPATCR